MLPLSRVQVAIASAGVVALALAVALGAAMRGGVGQPPLGAIDPGFATAAAFELPLLGGGGAPGTFALVEHRDRPVFVYFWASWCTPCKSEAPLIQRLWPEFEERGYTFVGVNIQDREQDARRFIEEHGLTFPQVRDHEGAVYLDYGVYGLPESFFLKPGLRVHEKYLGEFDEAVLRERLAAIDGGAASSADQRGIGGGGRIIELGGVVRLRSPRTEKGGHERSLAAHREWVTVAHREPRMASAAGPVRPVAAGQVTEDGACGSLRLAQGRLDSPRTGEGVGGGRPSGMTAVAL